MKTGNTYRALSPVWMLVWIAVWNASGCATSLPGGSGKSAWLWSGWKSDSSASDTDKQALAAGNSTENPFRGEQSASEKEESQRTSQGQSTPVELASASTSKHRFDAATMMLIETEFKDASYEERKQWFEELKQVPPEMVPRILRMRRLTQQAIKSAEQQEKIAARAADHSEQGASLAPGKLAVQPIPGDDSRPANPLNALNPWETTPRQISGGNSTQLAGQPGSPALTESGSVTPASGTSVTGRSTGQPAGGVIPAQAGVLSGNAIQTDAHSTLTSEMTTSDASREALERLVSQLEQRIGTLKPGELEEDRQHYTAQHAYLRMLYLMADRHERALEAIPQLPQAEQEFWQQMFWGLSNYFDSTGIPNPSDRATHAVSQLTEATSRLRERANLELRNLAFCKRIDGFGIYERFERDEFRPGQPVLVYAEMRNFLSEPTSDGRYKTILKSTIEIHRAGSQGGLVTRQDFTPTEDLCRNRRHDYFHSYMINIPDRVTVGPHVLKLIVEDQLNRKVASYSINFTVN